MCKLKGPKIQLVHKCIKKQNRGGDPLFVVLNHNINHIKPSFSDYYLHVVFMILTNEDTEVYFYVLLKFIKH